MSLPGWLLFASDATIAAIWGGLFLLIAGLAFAAEHLRSRRSRIDQIGFMPWTFIFLASATCGVALLTLAVQGWIRG